MLTADVRVCMAVLATLFVSRVPVTRVPVCITMRFVPVPVRLGAGLTVPVPVAVRVALLVAVPALLLQRGW
jgi:hypothetical protein